VAFLTNEAIGMELLPEGGEALAFDEFLSASSAIFSVHATAVRQAVLLVIGAAQRLLACLTDETIRMPFLSHRRDSFRSQRFVAS